MHNIHIPNFSRVKALVVGDAVLDRYWFSYASRLSREAPIPVMRMKNMEARPGGTTNLAVNIAALGVETTFLGITGDDKDADELEGLLKAKGVTPCLLRQSDMSTVVKLRVVGKEQQLLRLDFDTTFEVKETDGLYQTYRKLLNGNDLDIVVLSDYGYKTLREAQKLIQEARRHHIPVLVGPRDPHWESYHGATGIIPNREEFFAVAEPCHNDEEITKEAHRLIQKHQLEFILLTLGEKGMKVLSPEIETAHIPSRAKEVFDVTGAGDTVLGVLAAGVAAGMDLVEAAHLANVGAGIVVGKLGVASVTAAELRQELSPYSSECIVSKEELIQLVKAVQAERKKVVMTNGCFDILHMGHVRYLEEAKAYGDYLIVAINSDESVARLKGPARPINTLEKRMSVIAGLKAVDWVVSFPEVDAIRLLSSVKPDIYIKGGDWAIEALPEAPCVKSYGGQIKLIKVVEGCSTTNTIKEIQFKKP